MKEIHLGLASLLMVLCLLVGVVAGASMFPIHKTEIKEVAVEKEVIKEVEVEVEKIVEVEVEVPIENTFLEDSVEEVMKYLDDEDMFVCDNNTYDSDEVVISKIDDNWKVEYDEEDYTVSGNLRLKFKESDLRSCRESFDFEVFYEESEDPEVTM